MYRRELLTFLTVAEQGSFLKAAQQLYTTPASVMNQMNRLEQMVGAKLLNRSNHGTGLTAAGQSVYEDARKIIALSEEAVRKARQLAEAERNVIRVGTSILRPCKRLIELWDAIAGDSVPFRIRIVPFDDDPAGLGGVLSALGSQIDCIVAPCDSDEWRRQHSILLLDSLPCRIAVPRKHRLAGRAGLKWSDLDGETILIVKSGETPVLSRMREDIAQHHPRVQVADAPGFYDTTAFNECERRNCLMETLDLWADVHPSLVTLPMEWDYEIPYGIVYAKEPSAQVEAFIRTIRRGLPGARQPGSEAEQGVERADAPFT